MLPESAKTELRILSTRRRLRACVTAATLSAIAAASSTAWAAECEEGATVCGKREFDRGIAAYQNGRFAEAIDDFSRAEHLTPHPAILFNLALAELAHGEASAAAHDFQAVVADVRSDGKLRNKARQQLTLAESRSALITLDIPTTATTRLVVDGRTVPDVSTGVRVDPGLHWIQLTAGGRITVDHSVHLEAGEHLRLSMEVKTDAVAPPPSRSTTLPPGVAYATAGLTVALTGAAVWSGLDTLHARDAYERDLPTLTQAQAQARLDDGHVKELRTNLLVGGAVLSAAATAGIALFLVDWAPAPRHAEIGVSLGSIAVRGEF